MAPPAALRLLDNGRIADGVASQLLLGHAARAAAPALQPSAPRTPRAAAVPAAAAAVPARCSSAQRPRASPLEETIRSRGQALYEFELRRALAAPASPGSARASSAEGEKNEDEEDPGSAASPAGSPYRPPQGSAYAYPTWRPGLTVRLNQRFPPPSGPPPDPPSPVSAREARRERIRYLEGGLRAHDEERLRALGAGTAPLRGDDGEAVLPVPPGVPRGPSKLTLQQRLHLLSMHRHSKDTLRDLLIGASLLGDDATDRPPTPRTLARAETRLNGGVPASGGGSSPTGLAGSAPLVGDRHALVLRETADLVEDAERLLSSARATQDDWLRLATQLTARGYDAEPAEVLRTVRILGAAAKSHAMRTVVGKREVMRSAEQLIQSLTARLRGASFDLMAEVLETIAEVGVGSQDYLDMVMALILAQCHRGDRQRMAPASALRLASALGRSAAPGGPRLRPKGLGGSTTVVNLKCLEVLQERILRGIDSVCAEDLACVDDYFVTRLADEETARAIVMRLAELEIGLRGPTKGHLTRMVHLAQAIARELPESFRWALPRQARDYYENLRILGMKETAPWVLDPVSAARARLQSIRAEAY